MPSPVCLVLTVRSQVGEDEALYPVAKIAVIHHLNLVIQIVALQKEECLSLKELKEFFPYICSYKSKNSDNVNR